MEIYRILNKKNGKSYIGSTKWNFNERYPQGKWWVWTHSKIIKKAVQKYGLENFSVEILNKSAKDQTELSELEKLYIKQYNSFIPGGYNLTRSGHGKIPPTNIKEYELIDVFGTIYKIKNLSDFCQKNKLSYGAMLMMVAGNNKSSGGFALSTTNPNEIIDPNQEFKIQKIKNKKIYIVKRKNVPNFCKKINMSRGLFYKIIKGEVFVSRGFKLPETILGGRIREDKRKYKNYKFLNPDGKKITIKNIYKFCKDNKLDRKGFYYLISGKLLTYSGWRLPGPIKEFIEKKEKRAGKNITIKEIKTQKIIKIKNIRAFCRKMKLNVNTFYIMLSGKIRQYLGYCLPKENLKNYNLPKKIIYIKMILPNGDIIEKENPKEIEKISEISAQTIYQFLVGKEKMKKGFKVLNVKYYMDYYPEFKSK